MAHSSSRKVQRVMARESAAWQGITLTRSVQDGMVRSIQRGMSVFLGKNSNRLSNFAVRHNGEWYAVAYDRIRGQIESFHPPEYLDQYRALLDGESC